MFGSAKAPKKGSTSSSFGHAYVALLANSEPEERKSSLKGALLVEATAPISPHLREDDLTDAGVLLNKDANRREKLRASPASTHAKL